MELDFDGNTISLKREMSKLDNLAVRFSAVLHRAGVEHVFLSGYVAIIFGRNRSSEDIDVVCTRISPDEFSRFWKEARKEFECIITDDERVAREDYLEKGTAIRFADRGEVIPNIEMKFASNAMQHEAIEKALNVVLNGEPLRIAPFEQQIAYKLFLGSEKDIEDARFLFKLFRERLDLRALEGYLKALNISKKTASASLGWS